MELVGRARAYYYEEDGGLRLFFLCTNREEFDLKVSPAINRIPPQTVVRAWAERPKGKDGVPQKEHVLVHWEEL